MSQLPNPTADSPQEDDGSHRQATLILLDKKQWLYVQKQYNLTPRECEIAKLICRGLRNGSIASYLHIKPGTVKTHTRNIYRKVHVKSKISMLLRFLVASKELYNQYGEPPSFSVMD